MNAIHASLYALLYKQTIIYGIIINLSTTKRICNIALRVEMIPTHEISIKDNAKVTSTKHLNKKLHKYNNKEKP